MVYHIPHGFTPTLKKHGNSKGDVPFHPTWLSTKLKIKEECVAHGPKSTIADVSAKAGGVLKASAPGQLPRNEKQISNFKAKLAVQSRASAFPHLSLDAAADDLFIVMQQAYTEDASKKFVRALNAPPKPAVVVATEHQLQDLARFCTSSFEFSILTADPTFCLGEFDVTLITFGIFSFNPRGSRHRQCLLVQLVFTTRSRFRPTSFLRPLSLDNAETWKVSERWAQMESSLSLMHSCMNLALHST